MKKWLANEKVTKMMRKVKKNWVVVASVLLVGSAGTFVYAQSQSTPSQEALSDAIQKVNQTTNPTNWIANTVEQVKTEIMQQKGQNLDHYTIRWGDTLWAISQATGKSIDELAALNGIKDPNLIYAGDYLNGVLEQVKNYVVQKATQAPNTSSTPQQAQTQAESTLDVAVEAPSVKNSPLKTVVNPSQPEVTPKEEDKKEEPSQPEVTPKEEDKKEEPTQPEVTPKEEDKKEEPSQPEVTPKEEDKKEEPTQPEVTPKEEDKKEEPTQPEVTPKEEDKKEEPSQPEVTPKEEDKKEEPSQPEVTPKEEDKKEEPTQPEVTPKEEDKKEEPSQPEVTPKEEDKKEEPSQPEVTPKEEDKKEEPTQPEVTPKEEDKKEEPSQPSVKPTPSNPAKPVQPESGTMTEQQYIAAIQQDFHTLLNKHRTANGKRPIAYNHDLQPYADIRGKEIVTKFDHTRPNGQSYNSVIPDSLYTKRTTESGTVFYGGSGENIAGATNFFEANNFNTQSAAKVANQFFTQWKNSTGHNYNMLHETNVSHALGVGFKKDKNNRIQNIYGADLFLQQN